MLRISLQHYVHHANWALAYAVLAALHPPLLPPPQPSDARMCRASLLHNALRAQSSGTVASSPSSSALLALHGALCTVLFHAAADYANAACGRGLDYSAMVRCVVLLRD